jgi:hypothetical protein
MEWVNRLPWRYQGGQGARAPARENRSAVRGTIQRVDYQRQDLWVIAQSRAWRFVLAPRCQLWFNDTPAVLRCFHPLDPVTVLFRDLDEQHVAEAMFSWEPRETSGGSAAWTPDREEDL